MWVQPYSGRIPSSAGDARVLQAVDQVLQEKINTPSLSIRLCVIISTNMETYLLEFVWHDATLNQMDQALQQLRTYTHTHTHTHTNISY